MAAGDRRDDPRLVIAAMVGAVLKFAAWGRRRIWSEARTSGRERRNPARRPRSARRSSRWDSRAVASSAGHEAVVKVRGWRYPST